MLLRRGPRDSELSIDLDVSGMKNGPIFMDISNTIVGGKPRICGETHLSLPDLAHHDWQVRSAIDRVGVKNILEDILPCLKEDDTRNKTTTAKTSLLLQTLEMNNG